ncbi:MAG: hypothetical protein M3Q10_09300 [Chloroflexota bacterium]|nr:hypothetical protein [Chloroflexota bacterium]
MVHLEDIIADSFRHVGYVPGPDSGLLHADLFIKQTGEWLGVLTGIEFIGDTMRVRISRDGYRPPGDRPRLADNDLAATDLTGGAP